MFSFEVQIMRTLKGTIIKKITTELKEVLFILRPFSKLIFCEYLECFPISNTFWVYFGLGFQGDRVQHSKESNSWGKHGAQSQKLADHTVFIHREQRDQTGNGARL